MESIDIKRVTLDNIDELQKISRQTFFEAFSSVNTEEDMNKYLEENLSLERLSSELENENSEFYFAFYENKVIGYLKLNFGDAQTDIKDKNALEIERIYVLQEFYGKKVGQLFYNKALQIAEEMSAEYIWLGVWENNSRAINFYKKNGFVEFDKHFFVLGNDVQTDIIMKRQIKK